jgi:hypothetical protein
MPLEIDDKFEIERKKAAETEALKEGRISFGKSLTDFLQPSFERSLTIEIFNSEMGYVEYYIQMQPDRNGFFCRFKLMKHVLRVVDYRQRTERQFDFRLIVKNPNLRQKAEELAAWLALVHNVQNVKLHVTNENVGL